MMTTLDHAVEEEHNRNQFPSEEEEEHSRSLFPSEEEEEEYIRSQFPSEEEEHSRSLFPSEKEEEYSCSLFFSSEEEEYSRSQLPYFTVLFQTATFEMQRYLFSAYVKSFSTKRIFCCC